jgi:DHA2 family multidrug resistance protein
VDWLALLSFGLGLALLIVALKEAPVRGWVSLPVLVLFVSAVALSAVAVFRPRSPILFHLLKDRALAYGCFLSFLLGFTLFSAVYVMPVFLAFVRGHGPLQIGVITLVMGVSQIIAAPMIVQIDRYINARVLAAVGFAMFAAGLLWNASLTIESDYDAVFWPQVLRGAAVALCILPPIRMALALMPLSDVNDASGLFNLVRNVGGAIGIAVSDTIMFGRSPVYSDRLLDLLKTDAGAAAKELGMPLDELPANDDPTGLMNILDVVQAVSMTQAVNDCWMVLGAVSLLALPVLWLVGPIRSALPSYRLT